MQAVILAAGYGLRLRPFTETAPKGLVPILGRPLLQWTLERLPSSIDEIVIVTGWLGEQIEAKFGNSFQGKPVAYFAQSPINGTGSALHAAKSVLRGKFLVVNGDDVYTRADLEALSAVPDWGMLATQTAQALAGNLKVDDGGAIVDIARDESSSIKWQNCGAYVTDTTYFGLPLVGIPVRNKTEYSLPHTMVQSQKTHSVRLIPATQWLPIGTPEELAKAEKILDNI
jgi:NDP-sugar pyrophosphorylase family protein